MKDRNIIGYNIGIIINDLKIKDAFVIDFMKKRVYDTAKLFNSDEKE